MTEVRLTKARTFELDPAKKYLITIKEGVLSKDDTAQLGKQLDKLGIKNALFVILPKGKSLKVMESK